jgi:homoserine O-acetyltransferase
MGSTGPSSINPGTGKPYGLDFPIITIGDMVRAQRELVRGLGIERLLAVAGGSMGGMQVLTWATAYPDRLCAAIVIASTHLSGAQQIAFDAVGRQAITSDPAFHTGQYYGGPGPDSGLSIARMLAHITYLSDELMHSKFGRRLRHGARLGYDFDSEFEVETYLDYQGEQFVNRFDANSYLYITKAMDYFDISAGHPSLDAAMANTQGRALVLSYSSDWLYPPYQSAQLVYALARAHKDVSYCNILSSYGHDAFLLEVEVMKKIIGGFLEHVSRPDLVRTQALTQDSETDIGPPAASKLSIYEGHRVDYDMIVDLVEKGSRVLDIGAGDGELLCRLIAQKDVRGVAMEKAQGNVITCVRRGLSVIQADIDNGLIELPDHSFDYVILSMTLQVLKQPDFVLREMLRVGRKCIVSFPNFGHWKVRCGAFFRGRAPVTRNLPYSWYDTPNRHVLTIKDFREFCAAKDIVIEKEFPLSSAGQVSVAPNIFAEEALYVVSAKPRP